MDELTQRVESARQCWNSGDLAGYLSLYDPAIKLYGYGPAPFDKAGVTAFYETVYAALGAEGNPNPHLEFYEILTSGDLYACRFAMSGVHRGPFLGVPATRRPYTLNGITILRFRPDRKTVIERHSCADMLGLLVQLGAVPPPG